MRPSPPSYSSSYSFQRSAAISPQRHPARNKRPFSTRRSRGNALVGEQLKHLLARKLRRRAPERIFVDLLRQRIARQLAGIRDDELVELRVDEHRVQHAVDVSDRARRELLLLFEQPNQISNVARTDVADRHVAELPSFDLAAVHVQLKLRCIGARRSETPRLSGRDPFVAILLERRHRISWRRLHPSACGVGVPSPPRRPAHASSSRQPSLAQRAAASIREPSSRRRRKTSSTTSGCERRCLDSGTWPKAPPLDCAQIFVLQESSQPDRRYRSRRLSRLRGQLRLQVVSSDPIDAPNPVGLQGAPLDPLANRAVVQPSDVRGLRDGKILRFGQHDRGGGRPLLPEGCPYFLAHDAAGTPRTESPRPSSSPPLPESLNLDQEVLGSNEPLRLFGVAALVRVDLRLGTAERAMHAGSHRRQRRSTRPGQPQPRRCRDRRLRGPRSRVARSARG